jgi:hypothetical protein
MGSSVRARLAPPKFQARSAEILAAPLAFGVCEVAANVGLKRRADELLWDWSDSPLTARIDQEQRVQYQIVSPS